MIVVSNYVLDDMGVEFPEGTISRINLAWIKDKDMAIKVIKAIHNDVFLDFPHGRMKPPKPNIRLSEAIHLANTIDKVKYFAISNVEEYEDMTDLRSKLDARVEVVPKIETKRGVANLPSIIQGADTITVMLDKEDLYNDINRDIDLFHILVESARTTAQKCGARLLELRGVVFS